MVKHIFVHMDDNNSDISDGIFKVLMIYIVIGIIFGILKIELVLHYLDFRIVNYARLTS